MECSKQFSINVASAPEECQGVGSATWNIENLGGGGGSFLINGGDGLFTISGNPGNVFRGTSSEFSCPSVELYFATVEIDYDTDLQCGPGVGTLAGVQVIARVDKGSGYTQQLNYNRSRSDGNSLQEQGTLSSPNIAIFFDQTVKFQIDCIGTSSGVGTTININITIRIRPLVPS